MSEQIQSAGSDERHDSFARVVREGLSKSPRSLPAYLFYDANGSALFEQITALPEYYLTRTELSILTAHADEIVGSVQAPTSIVELGSGSGAKTSVLLDALIRRQGEADYYPIDVSEAALDFAQRTLRRELLRIHSWPGEYESRLPHLASISGSKLVLFIGSSIGNYEPGPALGLLRRVRASMAPGDAFLLGADLRKPLEVLLPAYDDALGVTAGFNKNVLRRINRDLKANFDLERFGHVALWNDAHSRIEMHLESERDQEVFIQALDLRIRFAGGERIHTENSYKLDEASQLALLRNAGFDVTSTWKDASHWFALHLCR